MYYYHDSKLYPLVALICKFNCQAHRRTRVFSVLVLGWVLVQLRRFNDGPLNSTSSDKPQKNSELRSRRIVLVSVCDFGLV